MPLNVCSLLILTVYTLYSNKRLDLYQPKATKSNTIANKHKFYIYLVTKPIISSY